MKEGASCHIEWKNVRRELEKIGVRVDHFAKTPSERERELADIRRQLPVKLHLHDV